MSNGLLITNQTYLKTPLKTNFFPSNTKFKLGDEKQVSAIKRVFFSACIAGKVCKIEAEIVKENIPLLLSKSSLKRCETIIDMNNDKVIISNKEIYLHFFSSSGHYCVGIVPEFKVPESCENVLILESEVSTENRYKQKRFTHSLSMPQKIICLKFYKMQT